MMKEKEFVLPVAQIMGPATNGTSGTNSSSRMDQKTVDALRGFLQDMTKTIHSLTNKHNMVSQSYKTCALQDADIRTSLPMEVPPTSLGMPPVAVDVPTTQSHYRDTDSVQVTSQSFYRAVNGSQLSKPYLQEAHISQSQELMIHQSNHQGRTTGLVTNGRCNSTLQEDNARNRDTGMVNFEMPTKRMPSEANSRKHQLDAKTVDALRGFLEEMKKTIQIWSIRHHLLVQGHGVSAREDAAMPDSTLSGVPSTCCVEPSRADGFSYPQPNQQVNVVNVMIQPEHGQAQAQAQAQAHIATLHQPDIGEAIVNQSHLQSFQTEHREAQQDEYSLSDHPDCGGEGNVTELLQHNIGEASVALLSQPDHEPQCSHGEEEEPKVLDQYPQFDLLNLGDSHDAFPCHHGGGDSSLMTSDCRDDPKDRVAGTGNDSALQVSPPSTRVVKVVESPDWLPHGWITEVKTRERGNSAGTKDKYYFDPVSKRRFRSKKEVFCFLTTGKLGRYKPRPKMKCDEEMLDKDCPSVAQPDSAYQPVSGGMGSATSGFMPPHSFSSMSGPSSFSSVSASGFFSNLFMPCRPGQPSEWLMYESLLSLPVPVFEHFQYSQRDISKPNSYRVHCNKQWISSNSEGSWKLPSYHNEVGDTVDEDSLQHPEKGMHTSETVQKHSPAGHGNMTAADSHNRFCGPHFATGQTVLTQRSQGRRFAYSSGIRNSKSQPFLSQLPEQKSMEVDNRSWDRNLSRSFQRHGSALKLPARKLKQAKPQGKKLLEALGRLICQQGLSLLQGCRNSGLLSELPVKDLALRAVAR